MFGKLGRCRRSWSAIGAVRSTCYTRPSSNMSKEETCQKLTLPGWPESCFFFGVGWGSKVWEVYEGNGWLQEKTSTFSSENISKPASFFGFTITKWWFWTLGWDLPRPVLPAKGAGGQGGERKVAMPTAVMLKTVAIINVYRCCMIIYFFWYDVLLWMIVQFWLFIDYIIFTYIYVWFVSFGKESVSLGL